MHMFNYISNYALTDYKPEVNTAELTTTVNKSLIAIKKTMLWEQFCQ